MSHYETKHAAEIRDEILAHHFGPESSALPPLEPQGSSERSRLATGSAIEIVRAFNAWRRSDADNSELPHSPVEIGQAIDEVVRLAKQAKFLRVQLQGIKARIEDSPYYGRIYTRGAVKELHEIADTAHNAIQVADVIKP